MKYTSAYLSIIRHSSVTREGWRDHHYENYAYVRAFLWDSVLYFRFDVSEEILITKSIHRSGHGPE
jgi:hypothetical protein